ncbi:hypothetical protein NFI96_015904 [Prochilodus magdalenae]|nr:hypothetical protein NFI96_015904 [Prochilodus magdalenae]
MSRYICLVVALIIAGAYAGDESETFTFPIKEVEECVQRKLEAFRMGPCFGEGCPTKTFNDMIPCFKLAYDLLYENSTYSLRGDRDVQHTAHCAIEKCAEGITSNKGTGPPQSSFPSAAKPRMRAANRQQERGSIFK